METCNHEWTDQVLRALKQIAILPEHEALYREAVTYVKLRETENGFAQEHGWRLLDKSGYIHYLECTTQLQARADPVKIQAMKPELEKMRTHLDNLPKPTPQEIVLWNNRHSGSNLLTGSDQLVKVSVDSWWDSAVRWFKEFVSG